MQLNTRILKSNKIIYRNIASFWFNVFCKFLITMFVNLALSYNYQLYILKNFWINRNFHEQLKICDTVINMCFSTKTQIRSKKVFKYDFWFNKVSEKYPIFISTVTTLNIIYFQLKRYTGHSSIESFYGHCRHDLIGRYGVTMSHMTTDTLHL